MVYQVSYELRTQDKDYTELYDFLEKELGICAIHVLRDTWWVDIRDKGINDICDKIRSHMGENDVFFVSLVSKDSTNGWLASSSWKWFNEHKA